MNRTTQLKVLAGAVLVGLLFAAAAPAFAATDKEASREMERARQEVERAREELRRATRELARSMAKVEKDNPRAQYFEFMTNPKRAVLGVIIDDEANRDDRGVKILAVTPGGGAEKAGLKAGDIMLSLDGESLAAKGSHRPEHRLREALGRIEGGASTRVEYDRDGKRSTATVVTQAPGDDMTMSFLPPLTPMALLEMDDEDFKSFMPFAKVFKGGAIRGLELAKLDDDLAGYFKTRDGVLVVKAPTGGELGLKSGDVIQKINGQSVSEPVTVMDKLRSRPSEQQVKIEVLRLGKKLTLDARIPVADASDVIKRKRMQILVEDDDK